MHQSQVSLQALLRITAASTLAGILPSMLHQIWHPSQLGLLYSMCNTAFAFFMLSYQVCECHCFCCQLFP